jgi:hypothetical protein
VNVFEPNVRALTVGLLGTSGPSLRTITRWQNRNAVRVAAKSARKGVVRKRIFLKGITCCDWTKSKLVGFVADKRDKGRQLLF